MSRECGGRIEQVGAVLPFVQSIRESASADQCAKPRGVFRSVQRHRSFEPFKSFREMAAHVPENMERPGQTGVTRWIGVGGPVERGAEIVVLGF